MNDLISVSIFTVFQEIVKSIKNLYGFRATGSQCPVAITDNV
ncbi:MAG TPA: hypothetical protein V6D11_31580 [Waterburya sp.]